jgi:pimeloyl-ACP methyl ester carboxylesterase
MRKRFFLASIWLLMVTPVAAQDVSGTWQGEARGQHVLKIRKISENVYRGAFFNLGPEAPGNPRNGNPVSTIVRKDRDIIFILDDSEGTFTGTLQPDGKAMIGTWQSNGPPQPLTLLRAKPPTAWVVDPSLHKTLFVPVAKDVTLEVLDWGGSGPALVFLPGLGNTAHVFDEFAPKFVPRYHVYGITRRGIGLSSAPPPTDENYDADRLGDDVVAVIDALKLSRPVLAGHSVAGEELSSVGTRHPDKVRGLIYLDAIGTVAFYNPVGGSLGVDVAVMRRDLAALPKAGSSPKASLALMQEMEATIPNLQKDFADYSAILNGLPETPPRRQTRQLLVGDAILANERKYSGTKLPTLAVVAEPRACAPNCDSSSSKALAASEAAKTDAFEAGNPGATIVRLPHANHYLFRSNEADVLREMGKFLSTMP